jgi:hypothetical protein
MTRADLVERLAEISHQTYLRQAVRDKGIALEDLSQEVAPHDRERAEDTVAELEQLGVLKPFSPE